MSKWKPVRSSVPHRSVLGPIHVNIFVDGIDSEIEGTLSQAAGDTKVSGAVDMLERRDAIQRDQGRLEEWASVKFMKFNNTKCKDRGNPHFQHRLGHG